MLVASQELVADLLHCLFASNRAFTNKRSRFGIELYLQLVFCVELCFISTDLLTHHGSTVVIGIFGDPLEFGIRGINDFSGDGKFLNAGGREFKFIIAQDFFADCH